MTATTEHMVRHIRSEYASTTAFIVAVAIGLVALATTGWLVAVGGQAVSVGLTHQLDDRWLVTSAAPGGIAWNIGIRPGMEVIGISPSDALPTGNWMSMLVTDGLVQLTVQRNGVPPAQEPLIAAAIAMGAGLLAYRFVPTVAWGLILVVPVIAALDGALGADPPLNLTLEVAGPLVGALCVAGSARLRPRPAKLLVFVTGAGLVLVWAAASAILIEDWGLVLDISVTASVSLGATALGANIASAIARARARSGMSLSILPMVVATGRVVDELIPGRSRTRLTAIERERARLATQLHSDVLPDLSAVIRSIEEGTSPEQAAERLRYITNEIRELMGERRLTVLEQLGLVPALEWLVEQVEAKTGVRVELDVEGANLDLEARPPREVELTAYRICQQAIDNALLHARPGRIRVRLDVDAGHAELEVSDDGKGIEAGDEERALRSGHLGLADMRQRATDIGAAVRIGAQPEGGTMVLLQWPA